MAVTADKRAEQPSSDFAPARFMREVYEELRKVVWPTGPELYRYTLVVIFTVILLGAFIGGTDYLLGEFAKRVIYSGGP
ncbi:MAG TPA: preprotein translocase subunit SecE [Candidatus Acidoferrum sp.]|jgi:preprotein translocase subunit SecE|nr:preprotein translocase subunit SecE [Candidatus Angelobacter sp.]HXD80344.1 preprotein translocase subunit SecE [Candidatus Acidoferrum sp.]